MAILVETCRYWSKVPARMRRITRQSSQPWAGRNGGLAINADALKKRQRIPGIYSALVGGAGVRPRDLARRFGVSLKTIRRDLSDMEAAGVPLFSDKGVWRMVGSARQASLDLTETEAVALFFALSCYRAMPAPPMGTEAEKAISKLTPLLPPGAEAALAASGGCYSVSFSSAQGYDGKEEMIDTIEYAMEKGIVLRISYASPAAAEVTEREFDPYALHFAASQWYLIGYCHLRGELRMLRVDRILACDETDGQFVRPPDFSVRDYLGNAWRVMRGQAVHVVVDFSPEVRPWVGRAAWHPTQRLEEAPDGWLRMHLDVPETSEVTDWILSYGGGAIVREPASLRQSVHEALQQAVANYTER